MTTAVQNSNPCLQTMLAAPHVGQAASPLHALLSRMQAVWHTARCLLRQAQAYAVLQGLDDRTLKDIGIHRTELNSMLHHDLRDPSRRVR